MAGVLLPTWALLLILAAHLIADAAGHVPVGLETAPFDRTLRCLAPGGPGPARSRPLHLRFYTAHEAVLVLPVGMALYYLASK
jgi:hypothetical protein